MLIRLRSVFTYTTLSGFVVCAVGVVLSNRIPDAPSSHVRSPAQSLALDISERPPKLEDTANFPIAAAGEDPNLVKKDRNETEADICCNFALNYGSNANIKNYDSMEKILQELPSEYFLGADENSGSWAKHPEIYMYSQDSKTLNAINKANDNLLSGSTGSCYRFVKYALNDAENKPRSVAEKDWDPAVIGSNPLVPVAIEGVAPKHSIPQFEAQGFINLMKDPKYKKLISSPKDAPKGSILIYSNPSDDGHVGHIEIKSDWGENGAYLSDFARQDHEGFTGRKLIGVLARPWGVEHE